jgi:hypothetical protein
MAECSSPLSFYFVLKLITSEKWKRKLGTIKTKLQDFINDKISDDTHI